MIGYYTDKDNSQEYPPFIGLFYPNKGNYIALVGNFSSSNVVKQLKKNFKSSSQFPLKSLIKYKFDYLSQ